MKVKTEVDVYADEQSFTEITKITKTIKVHIHKDCSVSKLIKALQEIEKEDPKAKFYIYDELDGPVVIESKRTSKKKMDDVAIAKLKDARAKQESRANLNFDLLAKIRAKGRPAIALEEADARA